MNKARELAIEILDMFEDVLDEHGIMVPDEFREGEESEACLYGATYAILEDRIVSLLEDYIRERGVNDGGVLQCLSES